MEIVYMEKLKKFGRYSKRVFNNLSKSSDETAHVNFVTDFKQEKFSIIWRIENIHRCILKSEEFLESPNFSTRFSSEVKWSLRFYPKGRKTEKSRQKKTCNEHCLRDKSCEFAGLFLNRLSSNPVASSFSYRFICESWEVNSSSKSNNAFIYGKHPEAGVASIAMDSTNSTEFGTDTFICIEYLKMPQALIIKCDIYITNACNMEASGNNMPDFSRSFSLVQDLKVLYENGKFSDVTLQAGEMKFPAHKAILASRSEVFQAMFQHDMKESQTNLVQIENIEPSILSSVLQYIYTGSVEDFSIEKAMALYPVADKYFLEELKVWCIDIMLANLSVENVCQIAVLGDLHPDPKLKEATFNMFRNFTSDIFRRKEWKELVRETDRRVLVSDILQAVSADFTTNCSNSNDK